LKQKKDEDEHKNKNYFCKKKRGTKEIEQREG